MTLPAPLMIGPSWLPPNDTITISPLTVTAWALPSQKSGASSEAADLGRLRCPVHRAQPRTDSVVVAGPLDLRRHANLLEGLRGTLADLGTVREQGQDLAPCIVVVGGDLDAEAAFSEGLRGPLDRDLIGWLVECRVGSSGGLAGDGEKH